MIAAAALIDEQQLRAESHEMDHLIGEIHDLVDPAAWQRIQRVMRCTVELYGQALRHALDHARAAGVEPGQFDALIGHDELLASLLVLHGLHPQSTEDRVRQALRILCEHAGGNATLLEIDDGYARISTTHDPALIQSALRAAAPELSGVDLY